jgi:hypothetical protein
MALGVDGVRIGTWTAPSGISGCTVVLPPAGSLGAIAVRGTAPGTREAAALGPAGKITVCHAVVLSGGSAYGLATADGVVRHLEEQGIGYPVGPAIVPIVGAAILLDAAVGDPASRPGADAGRAACEAATEQDPAEGAHGAGAGCTIAKVAGLDHGWRSGQGIAVRRAGGVTVGAIVANNAVGELVGEDGTWLARARVADDAPRYPIDPSVLSREEAPDAEGGGSRRRGGRAHRQHRHRLHRHRRPAEQARRAPGRRPRPLRDRPGAAAGPHRARRRRAVLPRDGAGGGLRRPRGAPRRRGGRRRGAAGTAQRPRCWGAPGTRGRRAARQVSDASATAVPAVNATITRSLAPSGNSATSPNATATPASQ